ncbi:MAG: 4-alpha-glucanotransferase [Verrucomicrobiota bacterium]
MLQKPLFNWLNDRSVGCLAHVSALPSRHGIGNLGNSTKAFLDLLSDCGMSSWQICPIGPTGYGDSPYSSFSAFAGNPYFIDWQDFVSIGLVQLSEIEPLARLPANRTRYADIHQIVTPLAQKVGRRWLDNPKEIDTSYSFQKFCADSAYWLEDYARFRVLKSAFNDANWTEWPTIYRNSKSARGRKLPPQASQDQLEIEKFIQYLFYLQWRNIQDYARGRGIKIIGDLPIFVAQDSADVWAHPKLFSLKKDGSPKVVAGVPPDFFSEDGQHWGNPLYDWKNHKSEGYRWWIERMRTSFKCFDRIRLDHFRGFEAYWEIPGDAENARNGKWVKGPGIDLFKAIHEAVPEARIIAEDLGVITKEVIELRDQSGFPGMAILQFAFGGSSDNVHLPHNLVPNQVVYPGSHDNDTTLGWYRTAPDHTKDHFRRYLRVNGKEAGWDLIRTAYAAPSKLAIIPLQDLLSLGGSARFNTPGAALGNWQWRATTQQLQTLHKQSQKYLRDLAKLYDRA